MKKETKNLLKIAKQLLKRETYNKIKTLNDETDLEPALKYSIVAGLEEKERILACKIKDLKQTGKDMFFAETKLIGFSGKLRNFQVDFEEKGFNRVQSLLEDTEKEIENV